jgi:hypothetical protein
MSITKRPFTTNKILTQKGNKHHKTPFTPTGTSATQRLQGKSDAETPRDNERDMRKGIIIINFAVQCVH